MSLSPEDLRKVQSVMGLLHPGDPPEILVRMLSDLGLAVAPKGRVVGRPDWPTGVAMAHSAMHRRAQLAESRAEKAEKALRNYTSIHGWLRPKDKA